MKNIFRICLIFFIVSTFGAKHISSADTGSIKLELLENAFNTIDTAYPKSRYFRSAGSLISGVFRCATARKMLNADNVMNYEKTAAYSLLGFSILRYVDGVKGFFFKSAVEKSLLNYRTLENHFQKLKYGEVILKKISKYGKRDRVYHSFLRGASSIVYFYLYFKDKEKYKKYLYSGLIYTGFAAFNLFSKSKAEKALKSYKEHKLNINRNITKLNAQFYIFPVYKGFRTGITVQFY